MSDLRPQDLNVEERAIVDALAHAKLNSEHEFWSPHGAYEQAWDSAEQVIISRRALFSSCGSNPPEASEEPAMSGFCCRGCNAQLRVGEEHFENGVYLCKPAPAKVESTPPSEMPEAVIMSANALRTEGRPEMAKYLEESWARSQPAPATLRMTPELERVIDAASARALWHLDNMQRGTFNAICDDVAAVRAQAEQPSEPVKLPLPAEEIKLRLPKVRELIELALTVVSWPEQVKRLGAALAELDEAEGKVTG